jgi:predicted phage tail protein
MLREIRLYGQLAKFTGRRRFMAAVDTAAEAIRFLIANFPGLEAHIGEPGRYYRVQVGSDAIDADELHGPVGGNAISIIPVVAGAGAVGRIIAGVALVALAIFVPGLGLGLAGSLVTSVGLLGGALILGGVSQLLTPTPTVSIGGGPQGSTSTVETELDPQKSYSFSGIQNTSRQGVPVSIIYGETVVGSVVISAGIDTVQVAA